MDPEDYLIICKGRFASCKDLVHRPFVIKEIHSFRGISDSVVFLYIIITVFIIYAAAYPEGDHKRTYVPGNIQKAYRGGIQPFGFKLTPGHLIIAGMDIHMSKRGIVPGGIALKVWSYDPGRFFIHCDT